MLEKEISFFESHRSEYCKVYAGQFVLVYGDKFLGSFTTEEQAYAFGIKSIGNVPFLIKRAVPVDEMASVPAYTLGLLSKKMPIVALVGRDILMNGLLVYNGTNGSFTLALN